jgi:hypothetical protein
MNLRTLLVRTCAFPLLGLVLIAGCGGGSEETEVAQEPNIGPGEPPGNPPGVKAGAPATPPKHAAEKK